MGIPGLLNQIGKGDRIALAKLAIDHYEKTKRPLRIAIDAAIWQFQHQSAQGGKNPELRTLFFRLLKLLALPIHPVFVYDGTHKPLTKRGRTVSRYGTNIPNEHSRSLVARFQFAHHTAPGEAEAECAHLQKHGIVDAVMSQDVDAIMFGSTLTLRDWSKEGTKGNKTPTHVNVLDQMKIKDLTGLDSKGMILVALLSGGDYHDGIPGFGPALACSIARAGFGDELVDLVQRDDEQGLQEWRERLQYELETNESGYFGKRHKTVVLPVDFPDRKVLGYYLKPAVSKEEDLEKLEARWIQWWAKSINIQELRQYTAITFDWMYKGGAKRFIRSLSQPLFQHRLKTQDVDIHNFTKENITERRQHFISDGIPELRLSAIPGDIVGIDLEAEEENPEYADLGTDDGADDVEVVESMAKEPGEFESSQPTSPTKRRKRLPWNPCIVEKWWIPEALLKTSLLAVVNDWYEEQRAIRADPVRFATRKCKPATNTTKKIDKGMKQGALKQYLPTTKLGKAGTAVDHRQDTKCATAKGVTSIAVNSVIPVFSSQPSQLDDSSEPSGPIESAPVMMHKSVSGAKDLDSLPAIQDCPAKRHSEKLTSASEDTDSLVNTLSPFITRRKTRQMKRDRHHQKSRPVDDDDEEIVFVSESKAPPPIASFFGPDAGKFHQTSTIEQEVLHLLAKSEVSSGKLLKKKLAAIPRDSLPGTWKELSQTTSQRSRVSFIDLTND